MLTRLFFSKQLPELNKKNMMNDFMPYCLREAEYSKHITVYWLQLKSSVSVKNNVCRQSVWCTYFRPSKVTTNNARPPLQLHSILIYTTWPFHINQIIGCCVYLHFVFSCHAYVQLTLTSQKQQNKITIECFICQTHHNHTKTLYQNDTQSTVTLEHFSFLLSNGIVIVFSSLLFHISCYVCP